MTLTPDDKPWAPEENEDYLCVLQGQQEPPHNREAFLGRQVDLLARLVAEASEREIKGSNRRLEEGLPEECLLHLPSDLLFNPRTPALLFFNPMSEGTPMHEWKIGFDDALALSTMPANEARQLAEGLSLESFLSRLL